VCGASPFSCFDGQVSGKALTKKEKFQLSL